MNKLYSLYETTDPRFTFGRKNPVSVLVKDSTVGNPNLPVCVFGYLESVDKKTFNKYYKKNKQPISKESMFDLKIQSVLMVLIYVSRRYDKLKKPLKKKCLKYLFKMIYSDGYSHNYKIYKELFEEDISNLEVSLVFANSVFGVGNFWDIGGK